MEEIYTITLENTPDSNDVCLVKKGLADFNRQKSGVSGSQMLNVFLRNARGITVGGLLGFTFGEWLHIQILWVEENVKGKGHGSRLIEAAENEAIKRGCKVADVSTFAFQAPEFYRKNGYEMFGELENAVGNHSIYFFRKNLK